MSDDTADLEPQTDASASPEEYVDKSVDTSVPVETTEEPAEVDAKADDTEEEVESEADSSPADEENVEETIDTEVDTDEQYGAKVKVRIDELTSKWRDSKRQSEALALENEELRKQVAENPKPAETLKTLADFNYDDAAFEQYRAAYDDRRTQAAVEKALSARDGKSAKQKAYDDYFATEKDFAETVKDYRKLVDDPDLRISPDMAEAIQVNLKDPGLVYYLASNKDVAERLSRMDKSSMLLELGGVSERMKTEKAKAKTAKTVSDAPPPVPKVKGGDPGVRKTITDPKLTDRQFAEMRRKQIAAR